MPTNKISISFSSHSTDIYHYLKTKENISTFICQLVRVEMNAKDTDNLELQTQVEKIIEKILKEKQLTINNPLENEVTPDNKNLFTKDDISLIKDLF